MWHCIQVWEWSSPVRCQIGSMRDLGICMYLWQTAITQEFPKFCQWHFTLCCFERWLQRESLALNQINCLFNLHKRMRVYRRGEMESQSNQMSNSIELSLKINCSNNEACWHLRYPHYLLLAYYRRASMISKHSFHGTFTSYLDSYGFISNY